MYIQIHTCNLILISRYYSIAEITSRLVVEEHLSVDARDAVSVRTAIPAKLCVKLCRLKSQLRRNILPHAEQ